MADKSEQGQKRQPWETVTLSPEGKWFAFKGNKGVGDDQYYAARSPENGHIIILNADGTFILNPDQTALLGHISHEEIERIGKAIKDREKTS